MSSRTPALQIPQDRKKTRTISSSVVQVGRFGVVVLDIVVFGIVVFGIVVFGIVVNSRKYLNESYARR